MGLGLHQAFWDLLCRLSDAGTHFEAQRFLVQRLGCGFQSNARWHESKRNVNSHSLGFALALILVAHGTCLSQQATTQPAHPWMNASLSPDTRADLVIKQLNLDEKIQLVHGIGWGPLMPGRPIPPDNNGGAGEILGIARLGIPAVQQADSAVGVRMAALQSRYATLLPSVLGATSSWDPKAAHL